jgi:hypothetical protein
VVVMKCIGVVVISVFHSSIRSCLVLGCKKRFPICVSEIPVLVLMKMSEVIDMRVFVMIIIFELSI